MHSINAKCLIKFTLFYSPMMIQESIRAPLRRGWTTGACATAAAKAALIAFCTKTYPSSTQIALPGGRVAHFNIKHCHATDTYAQASVIKDAGDDPDITHGCTLQVRLSPNPPETGITFMAGQGVGTVTRKGLPLSVGEPAINLAPRAIICANLIQTCDELAIAQDFNICISIPNGEELAKKTRNPHLGIVGGLSILGTTGVVIPYSCASWIHSIHRAVDVALANNVTQMGAATGRTSENWLKTSLNMAEHDILDVGDFVSGMAKYIKKNPLQTLFFAGGLAKITKMAHGAHDLHSSKSNLNFSLLAQYAKDADLNEDQTSQIANANTAYEAYQIGGTQLAMHVGAIAYKNLDNLLGKQTKLELFMISRESKLMAHITKQL